MQDAARERTPHPFLQRTWPPNELVLWSDEVAIATAVATAARELGATDVMLALGENSKGGVVNVRTAADEREVAPAVQRALLSHGVDVRSARCSSWENQPGWILVELAWELWRSRRA